MIRVEGLSRRYGERVALKGLDLEVGAGEMFGLLGPNGAGKSTAFALLAGLQRPDAGKLWWRGTPVSFGATAWRAEMGVVFQRGSLDVMLTAWENLMLGARLYAVPKAVAAARATELLGLMELSNRAQERVGKWSGGMRRRLELARALMHQPKLLLLDEPSQGLDDAAFQKLWQHVGQVRQQEKLSVLLTTHRPEEAALCDRVAVLDEGVCVTVDSPEALYAKVGGDVVILDVNDPQHALETFGKMGLSAVLADGRVRVEKRDGHALIPRLVEALPHGAVRSLQLRRPTLGDVFVKLTGRSFERDPARSAG
ncbi:MAG: ATP-binding cassette domain-containing protein [Myxococcaceae bacterium]